MAFVTGVFMTLYPPKEINRTSKTMHPLLINHQKTHTREKPLKCSICKKKIAVKIDMVHHQITHW